MTKKIRLAVIGGGINSAVGNTHLIASTMDFKAEIVGGFFSRDESINLKSGKRVGLAGDSIYDSVEDIVKARKNFDLVLLLAPTDDHFEYLKILLKARLNVVCEKALVLNSSQAEEVKRLAVESGSFLSVIYNYTGYPMIRELRELIKSGHIGEVCHFSIQMPQQSFMKKTGEGKVPKPQKWRLTEKEEIPKISLDLGVHVVNLMRFLIGKDLESVYCVQSSFGEFSEVIDFVSSSVCMKGGVVGQISYGKSFLGEDNGLEVKVYGKKGSLVWRQVNSEIIVSTNEYGKKSEINSSSNNLITAGEKRYHRFKPGHPTGFIESFANHYFDIFEAYNRHVESNISTYTFGAESAEIDLRILELLNRSSCSRAVVFNDIFQGVIKNVS